MRHLSVLCLALLASASCNGASRPASEFECTLFVVDEMNDVAVPYLACMDQFGELLFLWLEDFEMATDQEISSRAWLEDHRLPDEWFAEDLTPLPGTPPTIPPQE